MAESLPTLDDAELQRLRDRHQPVVEEDAEGHFLSCTCGDEECEVVELLAAHLLARQQIDDAHQIMGWYMLISEFKPINTERDTISWFQLMYRIGEHMSAYAAKYGYRPPPPR